MSKYLSVTGMFEIKKKGFFYPMNTTINPDTLTWKTYDTKI